MTTTRYPDRYPQRRSNGAADAATGNHRAAAGDHRAAAGSADDDGHLTLSPELARLLAVVREAGQRGDCRPQRGDGQPQRGDGQPQRGGVPALTPAGYLAWHDGRPRQVAALPAPPPLAVIEPDLPLPAAWYAPDAATAEQRYTYAAEIKAAVIGLAAGFAVIVPAFIWVNSTSAPPRPALKGTAPISLTAGLVPGPVDLVDVRAEPLQLRESDHAVEEARRLIGRGDILGARNVLATAAAAKNARALFAMAETYDPNVLAGWGTRGVDADAELARTLYDAAARLGHGVAAARIAALR